MDAVVQLIRNGLCCIKDLEWFQETLPFLYDPDILPQYYLLPEPMNKTTPLELMIAVTQLYACVSLVTSGWRLLHTSYGKLVRIQRIIDSQSSSSTKDHPDADRLIKASLIKEAMYALRSMFIGSLILCIGTSFFWLFSNSLHITEAGWIGGTQALIHALTVAEAGLLPLLYYMWKDAGEQFRKAARMEELAHQMKQLRGSRLKSANIDLSSFEALTNWLPFWDSGVSIFGLQVPDPQVEEKLVVNEKLKVQRSLEEISGSKNKDKMALLEDKSQELLTTSRITKLEGYRELIFFVLNAIAFYGYAFCVLTFYYENEDSKPYYLRVAMFGLENPMADWYGNFYGDLMWTIEPIVLLSSTVIFASMRTVQKQESKAKSD